MTDEPPKSVGLYADEDSVIIADGATVTGFDEAAKATNNSTISLKGATTDSKSINDNNSGKRNTIKTGIIVTIIGGVAVLFIDKIFF